MWRWTRRLGGRGLRFTTSYGANGSRRGRSFSPPNDPLVAGLKVETAPKKERMNQRPWDLSYEAVFGASRTRESRRPQAAPRKAAKKVLDAS